MSVRAAPDVRRVRDVGAIVFNLFLTSFAATIVVASFGLRPGARLVPLVIGIPTLIGMAYYSIREIVGHVPAAALAMEDESPSTLRDARLSTLADLAAKEVAEDNLLPMDPESVQKRRVFVIWAILVLVLAWFFNFYVAMIVGLVSIYRYARIGWLQTVAITGVLVGTVYLTFDLLLGVRF